MDKDITLIPYGDFCYTVTSISPGEVMEDEIDRFGKDLREFTYHKGRKEVLCPYWIRTDYGTLQCRYMEVEVLDEIDKGAREKLIAHTGDSEAVRKIRHDCLFNDEVKICDVRMFDEE